MSRLEAIKGTIIETVCDLSGLDEEDFDSGNSFIELGFDSLFMTQLAAAFQRAFSLKITFRQLLNELSDANKLAAFLDSNLSPDRFQDSKTQVEVPDAEPTPIAVRPEPLDTPPLGNYSLDPTHTQAMKSLFAEQLKIMSLQLAALKAGTGAGDIQPRSQVESAPPGNSQVARQLSVVQQSLTEPKPSAAPQAHEEPSEQIKLPAGFVPQVDKESLERRLPEQQQAHLDKLIALYNSKTPSSKAQTQKYRSVHADPRTAAGFSILWKEMVYPIVVERSSGSRIWDIDGNEYIDILNGFGPNFLGHAPPFIQSALIEQVKKGFEIGPQTPLAGQVAQMICDFTGLERATFVNTGSEAVQAVIRLSRTVTGKDKVVVFNNDYHGNFDEVLVRGTSTKKGLKTLPLAPGIPREAVNKVLVLEYGADESLELIEQNAHEIAAVLIEPIQSRRPDFRPKEFIQKLRTLTEIKDIVFVFDEVITGFRTGLGGAQAYYEVEADLATYGKVIGGGLPIGVVAGKAKYMDTFDGGAWRYGDSSYPSAGVTFFAGTFVRHPLAIAAAHATLTYLKEQGPDIYKGIYAKTSRLATSLNGLFEENEIGIFVAHFSSQMYFRITDDNPLLGLLFYHARAKGLYMLEGFPSYLTLAHTDADVDRIIEIFTDSVKELQAGGITKTPPQLDTSPFPLTDSQREILFASQISDISNCAYNESDTLVLQGKLKVSCFEQAVNRVVNRHPAFKTVFSEEGEHQCLDSRISLTLRTEDFSALSPSDRKRALSALYKAGASTPFDLSQGPLLTLQLAKIAEDEHLFIVYAHHMIFDGWSSNLIFDQIGEVYTALASGGTVQAPRADVYRDYVHAEISRADTREYRDSLAYWQRKFTSPPNPLQLPLDHDRPRYRTFNGSTEKSVLPPDLSSKVKQSAKAENVTLFVYLLAVYQILLYRLSEQEDTVVGINVAGQAMNGFENLVGHCVNLLPLRIPLSGDLNFSTFLRSVRDELMNAYENHDVAFSAILRNANIKREANRAPLVEAIFNFGKSDVHEFSGLHTEVRENPRTAIHVDLFFNIMETGDSFTIDLDYHRDLFSGDTIVRWINHYKVLLDEVSSDPSCKLRDIPLMSTEERAQLLAEFSGS